MPLYRTGLMIIRAWVEKGSRKPLRAHIRATTDVSKGLDSELIVADTASASAKVEAWLGDVQKAAADDDAAPSLQEENKR
jgi:hypothetical protein